IVSANSTTMTRELASAYQGSGKVYANTNQLDEAKSSYQRSFDFYKTIGDQFEMANTLAQLGEVFYASGNFRQAEDYQLESLKIAEAVGYKRGMSYALRNLGYVILDTGQVERSSRYF